MQVLWYVCEGSIVIATQSRIELHINRLYSTPSLLQETHILHEFADDFYGADLSVCVAGYIRPEKKFNSLGMLGMF